MRRVRYKRLAISLLAYTVIYTWLIGPGAGPILRGIEKLGQAAGCDVVQLGLTGAGAGGPFMGTGLRVRFFNLLARNGVWWSAAGAGFAAAMTLTMIGLRLEHTRLIGYRGPTRCGRCGYTLRGLREPRCPECETAI